MLRRFLYLDTSALDQYIAIIEDGLITERTRRTEAARQLNAGVDVKIAKTGGERSSSTEDGLTLSDAPASKFERFLKAVQADPEGLGWIDALDPDDAFTDAGIGAMVSWECDVYVPEIVQVLASTGEGRGLVKMLEGTLPLAEKLGLETDGLPGAGEVATVAKFMDQLDSKLVVVGDRDDTDWKVAGQLAPEFVADHDLDGPAIVVGKVSRHVKKGSWKPFLAFPGMQIGSREQRRKLEKTPPKPGEEDNYLHGPAVMLDVLAIFR